MEDESSKQNTFSQVNLEEYKGKWVAICEENIVCYGDNAKETFEEAKKKCSNKKIILARVPEEQTMIY